MISLILAATGVALLHRALIAKGSTSFQDDTAGVIVTWIVGVACLLAALCMSVIWRV